MSGIIVHHDEGGGITQRSLDYWKEIVQPEWRVHQVSCRQSGMFTTEVVCFDSDHNLIVVLLSGMNCGYSGEGPRGLLTLLEDCGYQVTDTMRNYVYENSYVSLVKK